MCKLGTEHKSRSQGCRMGLSVVRFYLKIQVRRCQLLATAHVLVKTGNHCRLFIIDRSSHLLIVNGACVGKNADTSHPKTHRQFCSHYNNHRLGIIKGSYNKPRYVLTLFPNISSEVTEFDWGNSLRPNLVQVTTKSLM